MEPIKAIKGYELHERIGSGGFGVVHRATQTTVGREVAIKIILPHFANQPDFIRRFETEAQLIARLEHLHIVPLYDYWRDSDGAYLVMRWLRGGNLRDALANGPFELEATALLMDQITSALAMAHHNGIVHRDLKPANILLDEDGNAYLSDFGIAKDTTKIEGTLTGTGMVLGSPDYLSPEQARSEPVAPPTDIYSLGVMLYEVLTGHHPFPNLSSVERMYKHLNEPLPRLESLPPEMVEGVNAIIQKATAKNPAQRYVDVLEMAADFRREADLSKRSPESIVAQLTLREQEILQMITEGCSNKDIAEHLFITVTTVKWHIRQVYQKLHVRSRVQAIMRARDLNLIGSDTTTEPAPGESTYIALPEPENPYKGLRAFQTADARDFFGREKLVQRLVQHLGGHDKPSRFLAVVGPSGSGKSSVVKAGLVPALGRGDLPGSERWFVVEMIPGAHPLDELEIALTRVAANQAGNLREHLERDLRGLVRVAGLILPDDGSELVIIVDQFEEVFTLVENEGRRTQFLDLLYTAATDPRSRVRVIITLRADFYDRPLHYPQFGELVRACMETVMPLSADELEAAIARPAARVGVSFEPGLVAIITGDVHYQPGALPLLQYALTELFEQRTNRTLTHEAYQVLGGTTGALTRRAEELYHEQDEAGQETLRQMFLRLVTLGEGVEDTRRRVPRSELLAVGGNEDRMDDAIDAYAAYRLLTLDHDPATRSPTVEIAHEAILREWERLRAWLNESRHDIQQQRLLGTAAADWQEGGQDKSYLLHGTRLQQIEAWAAETELALTQHERHFLNTCTAERERQEAAERQRQAGETALKQRAQRVLQLLVGVFLLAAIAGIGLAAFAFDREQQAQDARAGAEREAAVNHSLVLAGSAEEQFKAGNADLALALALEAVKIDSPPPEARLALSTVALGPGTRVVLRQSGVEAKAVAFSPDSRWALSGGCAELSDDVCNKGELILWDMESAAELRHLEGHTGWVTHVAFNPVPGDGPLTALSASGDGTQILWNVETGEIIRHFEGHTGGVNTVVFNSTGQRAVSGAADGTLILWDVATGNIIRRFEGHTGPVNCAAFSPDDSLIASGSDDQSIILWNVETGEVLHQLNADAAVIALAFRTDSQGHVTLFSGSSHFLREWDIDTGEQIRFRTNPSLVADIEMVPDGRTFVACEGNACELYDLEQLALINPLYTFPDISSANALSPDGHSFLAGFQNGALILVNMPVSSEIRRFEAEGGLMSVDVSPDGRYLLTGSVNDGFVILWDLQISQEICRLDGLTGAITFSAFSPDGKQALIGSADAWRGTTASRLVLWDVDTGQIIHELTGFEFYPRSYAFSADGRTVLVGTEQWGGAWKDQYDGELILYDLESGVDIRHYEPVGAVMGIALSRDGHFALTGNDIHGVSYWNLETGEIVRSFDFPGYGVVRRPDEDQFVVGSSTSSITLDPKTGNMVRQFVSLDAASLALDVSPDGSNLLSGNASGEGTIAVWDLHTGALLRRFTGYPSGSGLWNLVYSPDGHTAFSAAAGPDEAVIEWQIAEWPLEKLLAWVHENRYVRDLTCEERAQYRIEPLCE
jgi:WD40 repeat protein/serine/threonine protein kinase